MLFAAKIQKSDRPIQHKLEKAIAILDTNLIYCFETTS